jgi:phosphohistidine phosphatase
MPRRLILMRHAKSDWTDTDATDHARVLNPRGRAACDAIGPWLAAHGYVPDEVLCSDAARTQETWARIAPHLPDTPAPTLRPDLYLAEPGGMLGALQGASGAVVAMVGHNPGIGSLAAGVVADRPSHRDFGRYPTLATLVADFDIDDWSAIVPFTGRTVDFIVPRDLTD